MGTNGDAEPLSMDRYYKILDSGYGRVKIVEFRGPLGPRGMRIYRVRVRRKPKPVYIEVREDQLEEIPATK